MKKITQNEFIVFLNFSKNSPSLNIRNLYKPSNTFVLKKKDVIKLIHFKKQLLVLSNSTGIDFSKNIKTGGIIVAKIYL